MTITDIRELQKTRLRAMESSLEKLKKREKSSITRTVAISEITFLKTTFHSAVVSDTNIFSNFYHLKDEYFLQKVFVRITKVFEETYDYIIKVLKEPHQQSESKSDKRGTKRHITEIYNVPKLTVPSFSGAPDDNWINFRNHFKVLVHDSDDINDSERLFYLTTYLKGDAASLISDITIENENYGRAWKRLKLRYHCPYLTFYKHLNKFIHLEKINENSPGGLRLLADEIENSLFNLKCLQVPTADWDLLLIHFLKQKLDELSLDEWETLMLSKETDFTTESFEQNMTVFLPKIDEFVSFLKNRAEILIQKKKNYSNIPSINGESEVSANKKSIESLNNSNSYEIEILADKESVQSLNNSKNNEPKVPIENKPVQSSNNSTNNQPAYSNKYSKNNAFKSPSRKKRAYSYNYSPTYSIYSSSSNSSSDSDSYCPMCFGSHKFSDCLELFDLSTFKRKSEVIRNRRCFNCLGKHHVMHCPSSDRCDKCSMKHHTLLHYD